MKSLNKSIAALIFAGLIMALSSVPARAEEGADLKVFITPYAWLMSVKGDVGARGYTARVDAPFTTLTKHVNFAGMLAVDLVAYDKFGFTGNINAALLGGQSSHKGISLDSESGMILSDAALFYRLGRTPLGDDDSHYIIWDVYAGARIWDLRAKLDISHPYGSFKVSQHETWADPIVGAKAWLRFADDWSLELRGDIGGWGKNDTGSKLTWGASSILAYSLWDNGNLMFGYRAVGVDYKHGSGSNEFEADAILHGPILGLSIRF